MARITRGLSRISSTFAGSVKDFNGTAAQMATGARSVWATTSRLNGLVVRSLFGRTEKAERMLQRFPQTITRPTRGLRDRFL